jgi:hypothetical protein
MSCSGERGILSKHKDEHESNHHSDWIGQGIRSLLTRIQQELFTKAKQGDKRSLVKCNSWDTFESALRLKQTSMVQVPWCQSANCEKDIGMKCRSSDLGPVKNLCILKNHNILSCDDAEIFEELNLESMSENFISPNNDSESSQNSCFNCLLPSKGLSLFGRTF